MVDPASWDAKNEAIKNQKLNCDTQKERAEGKRLLIQRTSKP